MTLTPSQETPSPGTPGTDARPADVRRALLERRLRAAARGGAAPGIPRRPDGTAPPLSYGQERLWFMEQYAPGTTAYHIPVWVRLRDRVDVEAMGRALTDLAARHEPLRTRFPADDDGLPTVVVAPVAEVPLPVEHAESEEHALARIEEVAAEPFDLADEPPLRARLFRLADDDHLLLVTVHHIASDGWSTEILLAELLELYGAHVAGRPPRLRELPARYGDYAAWQRDQLTGEQPSRQLAYWKDRLTGVEPLDLPTDLPRPATQSFEGARHVFHLDQDLVDDLTKLGREHGATLFMTLLAGYQLLLAQFSGQDDFAVGSPVAGRSRPELEALVGMFVNMLPLRAHLTGGPTVAELLDRTRRTVLDALANAEVPFEHLVNELGVERDTSRSPLFQVTFAMQNYEMRDLDGGDHGTGVSWKPVDVASTRFDLELHTIEMPDRLQCTFVYNTTLFTEPTITALADQMRTVLRAMTENPGLPVRELDLLDEAGRRRILTDFNDTDAEFPAHATLHGLVAEQVARTPDAPAVVCEGAGVSYAELDAAANRVAHRLRELGVGPESVVGVCAERSVELVVALLGVLKAGAAYLPLDAEYPADRLAFMLGDAAAPVVLTQSHLTDRLPDGEATTVPLDGVLEGTGGWAGEPVAPQVPVDPAGAAYVIYTSGSTGRPKGVVNSHRGIVNRLHWMQRYFGLTAEDRVLQKTPASFDVSVWEFFWPLLTGATLVMAKPGGHKDAVYLRDLIVAERITTAHFVPSMLAVFLSEDGLENCTSLRRAICSGEELPEPVARDFLARLPGCGLYNLYGPTEAAVDVSAVRCEPGVPVTIGSPIDNIRLYVLDDAMRPVPLGVPGHLHIGGVGVARGYLGRPGLTAERFVPDPYGPAGGRLYATGDLARWTHEGTLHFLGRIDNQVKLRGLRIELGEIEAALRDQPGVRDAAVVVRDERLVGYLVGVGDQSAIRAALKERLPDYMVPGALVELDALPLTPNGKLDRKALPAPTLTRDDSQEFIEPRTDTERLVARIWAEVIGVEKVGARDDFFDLGGHSLLATQVVARLRKALDGTGRAVSVMDIFANRTVEDLAALIDGPDTGPRGLLHRLTPAVPAHQRVMSYVCVPYGGGSAVVYQPLADALPPGHELYSVGIPGHDVGLDEESLPFDELARRCTEEILAKVEGPVVLYGHCGVGGALIVELARRLEAAGRELEAVYTGAVFPFTRAKGRLAGLMERFERLTGNRNYENWLKSMGVTMDELDPEQADRIISNMRADSRSAEAHFTTLSENEVDRLKAPIITVVGEQDPVTDYYQERYREWQFLAGTTAVVVLEEAGHFFLKYRADELVEIITGTHRAIADGTEDTLQAAARPDATWWLHAVDRAGGGAAPPGGPDDGTRAATAASRAEPSMRRFLTVSLGQFVSLTGTALTQWALPIWIYTQTNSLTWFGMFGVVAMVPGILLLPLAGAFVDRLDRRRILIAAGLASGTLELVMALLFWTDRLQVGYVLVLLGLLAIASVFQRTAFTAAIPQLAPKRYLGHANGVNQLINGAATLFMPLVAAALLAGVGLGAILAIDIVSYVLAVGVLLMVRFPDLMGRIRREQLLTQIKQGFGYLWHNRGFRAVLLYSGSFNLLLATPMLLISPLVLEFGTMADVGTVSFAEALGAIIGGLTMTLWGGPQRRLMPRSILATLAVALFFVLAGLRPSVGLVAVGMFGAGMGLVFSQSIYMTILQVKVPQRFHGRVVAITQAVTWSTFPIGFGILAPLSGAVLEPLMAHDGALASTVGAVIGTGPGRGIALAFILFGLGMAVVSVVSLRSRILSRLDIDMPDALPDDLVGAQVLAERSAGKVQNDG
ncbi:non-ribosomal peptide synthetase/MFS transporter [Microtetraspora sp. NBRC 16547]|uniref:non-ribosomal peptide synthetase/MFS transporter n=1 Tax=Microtetraspora sp. NBRC 16547 TaxID=3030993 RepID=UPI0024A0ED1F|nr:non-ribosomal peptide synthetase/MFS transporter [Microtetraspora sp. NBRC 16547]GLX00433.1 hypothetical protein Misp02_45190 [Microtetraspora sp. NBRC 16547]